MRHQRRQTRRRLKDAYARLRALVAKQLSGRPDAELVLTKHEQAPEVWQAPLMAEPANAADDRDLDLVRAARALMTLVDEAGSRAKYTVDVRGARGVQVGGGARQDNVFNATPGGSAAWESGRVGRQAADMGVSLGNAAAGVALCC